MQLHYVYYNAVCIYKLANNNRALYVAPLPPPTDVQLVEANNTHLSFNWTQVSLNCPSIEYHIMTSNCGKCPTATPHHAVTCSGNYTWHMNDQKCVFAIQTVVCNNIIGPAVNISIILVNTTVSGMVRNFNNNNCTSSSIEINFIYSTRARPKYFRRWYVHTN